MKKISLFLVSLIMFAGCSDTMVSDSIKNDQQENLSDHQKMNTSNESYGDMHNELLALLEQAEVNGEITVDVHNKSLSADMVNIIDNYFYMKGGHIGFSTMLAEIPDLSTNLNSIFNVDHSSVSELRNMIINTSDPTSIKEYSLLIFDVTVRDEGTNRFYGSLNNIRNNIIADNRLSPLQKEQLVSIISIATSSNAYWYPSGQNNIGNTTYGWQDRLVYLAGSDTASAIMMIQTGAVATGAALTATIGGWGGLAVLIGGAAAGSYMASRR